MRGLFRVIATTAMTLLFVSGCTKPPTPVIIPTTPAPTKVVTVPSIPSGTAAIWGDVHCVIGGTPRLTATDNNEKPVTVKMGRYLESENPSHQPYLIATAVPGFINVVVRCGDLQGTFVTDQRTQISLHCIEDNSRPEQAIACSVINREFVDSNVSWS